MRERRRFSAAFKREMVRELLSGVYILAQLSRRHDLSSGLFCIGRSLQGGEFSRRPSQSGEAVFGAHCGAGEDGGQADDGD